jgi:hypothetical protein
MGHVGPIGVDAIPDRHGIRIPGPKEGRIQMVPGLSEDEREYVQDLLAWDGGRRSLEWFLCNVALVIGGLLIVGAVAVALAELTDRVILGVLVPGFVVGLFLVALYALGGARIRERRRIAFILKKLTAG